MTPPLPNPTPLTIPSLSNTMLTHARMHIVAVSNLLSYRHKYYKWLNKEILRIFIYKQIQVYQISLFVFTYQIK